MAWLRPNADGMGRAFRAHFGEFPQNRQYRASTGGGKIGESP
jgi:hypothetical protein